MSSRAPLRFGLFALIVLILLGAVFFMRWGDRPEDRPPADALSVPVNDPVDDLGISGVDSLSVPADVGETDPATGRVVEEQEGVVEFAGEGALPRSEADPVSGRSRAGSLADPDVRARRVEELRQREEEALARARAWAEATGSPMRIETNGVVMVLIDYTDERGPVYRRTMNEQAAVATATDVLWDAPYGLRGAGQLAGIWDGGDVRNTHQEFVTNRVVNFDDVGFDDHATHVAGTMIAGGVEPGAQGMAPLARVDAYDFFSDLPQMASRAMAAPGEEGMLQVSNHSYGFLAGWFANYWYGTWLPGVQESDYFGWYSVYDAEYDALLYEAPYYLPFFAAGNDRNALAPNVGHLFFYWSNAAWRATTYDPAVHPFDDGWKDGGYNTIPYGGTAKNAILIGAIQSGVTAGERDVAAAAMSSFSAWGPTDDGRIKPDLVARGVGLFSAVASGNAAYSLYSGTSMSTPNASGSALLMLEHFDQLFPGEVMRASSLRALMIHTADALAGPGPDYRHGWGLLNARAAIDHLSEHAVAPEALRMVEDSLSTTNAVAEYTVRWNNQEPLIATLAWTDPPGPTNLFGLNLTNIVLVNDLDLRVIAPNGSVYYPWVLDPANPGSPATTGDNVRDNVEQVRIDLPPLPGLYTVQVSHKGELLEDEQAFSLMMSGSAASLTGFDPVELTVTGAPTTWGAPVPPYGLHVYELHNVITLQAGPVAPHWDGVVIAGDEAWLYGWNGWTNQANEGSGFGPWTLSVSSADAGFFVASSTNVTHGNIDAEGVSFGLFGNNGARANAQRAITEWGDGYTFSVRLATRYRDGKRGIQLYEAGGFGGDRRKWVFEVTHAGYGAANWNYFGDMVIDLAVTQQGEDWLIAATGSSARQSFSASTNWVVTGAGELGGVALFTENELDDGNNAQRDLYFNSLSIAAPILVSTNQRYRVLGWTGTGSVPVEGATNEVSLTISEESSIEWLWGVQYPLHQHADLGGAVSTSTWWDVGQMADTVAAPMVSGAAGSEYRFVEWLVNGVRQVDAATGLPANPASGILMSGPRAVTARYLPADQDTGDTGLPDWWRLYYFNTLAVDPDEDSDGDGYTNAEEFEFGTDPTDPDDVPHWLRLAWSPTAAQTFLMEPDESDGFLGVVVNTGTHPVDYELLAEWISFEDNIESGAAQWLAPTGAQSFWHISTNRSAVGQHAWYNGQPGTRQHSAWMDARLDTRPFHVVGDSPRLLFQHYMDAELAFDEGYAFHGGRVLISTNGTDFVPITPVGGYPFLLDDYDESVTLPFETPVFSGSNDWTTVEFDLSEYEGTMAQLRFQFVTDSFYNGRQEGWYIDDVRVVTEDGAETWLTITPDAGSLARWETNEVVITVTSAGLPPGAYRTARIHVLGADEVQPADSVFVRLDLVKEQADVFLSDLQHIFDGMPKAATATTEPPDLQVVLTYDGEETLPLAIGSYTVVAAIDEFAWQGGATGTLEIVALTGAIEVEDTILPADDSVLPFGELAVGRQRTEQIIVRNTNTVYNLILFDLAPVPPSPPSGPTGQSVAGQPWQRVSDHPEAAERAVRRRLALASDAPRAVDTLLVRFESESVPSTQRAAAHAAVGAELRHRYQLIAADVVRLPVGMAVAEAVDFYEALPGVAYAEPNYAVTPTDVPNDPDFNLLWGLHNTGQSGGTPGADISALAAWEMTRGHTNVVVAVLDTGIDYNHPDLAGNMWINPNPTFGDIHGARWLNGDGTVTNADPMDGNGHGTHVAGTIGAIGNNGIGVVGVNWQVRLMALKFLPDSGSGSVADGIAALEYAVQHGARISNNSWGAQISFIQTLADAIEAAEAQNHLFVAAAGNNSANNDVVDFYPANYAISNVISVANSNRNDERSPLSNWGVTNVHLAAPGTSIRSTEPGNRYGSRSGTSMAAPHVSGTAALMLALRPEATYAQLKEWLLTSVTPSAHWETRVSSGGRLNARAALELAMPALFLPDIPEFPLIIPPGGEWIQLVRFAPRAEVAYEAAWALFSNDMDAPQIMIALTGTGTAPVSPVVELLSAQQTSTDGSGLVTLELSVADRDVDAIDLAFEYSGDHGLSWTNAWISAATPALGAAIVQPGAALQVQWITVRSGGLPITNDLDVVWSSAAEPSLSGATGTLVRVRAWNGLVWSDAVISEPFLVDNTPPDATFADVQIASSALGNYTFSPVLSNTWSGFTDTLSGIAGYYIALVDGGGTTNGLWIVDEYAIIADAVVDATNTVYVWAQDAMGNIGNAASSSIVVLSEGGRWNGGTMSNYDKEIAGLSPLDGAAVFAGTAEVDVETGGVTLQWPYAPGREYEILVSEDPLGPNMNWTTLMLSAEDYDVVDGRVVWADDEPLDAAIGRRYYRIGVRLTD